MQKSLKTALSVLAISVSAVLGGLFFLPDKPSFEYFPDPQETIPCEGVLSGSTLYLRKSGTESVYCKYDISELGPYQYIRIEANYLILTDSSHKNGTSERINVFESRSSGLQVGNTGKPQHHIIIEYMYVENSVLENYPPSVNKQWGSCIKLWINVEYVKIRNNRVVDCYGEGIAPTESRYIEVFNNFVKDSWSAGIYPDNATHVLVEKNTVVCDDPALFREGKPCTSILMGSEKYAGQYQGSSVSLLGDINILSNISYTARAISYWGGLHNPQGLQGAVIKNNIAYDTSTRIWIYSAPLNSNIVIENNQYLTSGQPTNTVVPLTSTKTATVIPTKTITISPTKTLTPTPVLTITRTPTLTPTNSSCVVGFNYLKTTVQINTYPKSVNIREDHNANAKAIGYLYSDPGIRHSIVGFWTDCNNYWASIDDGHWFALKLNNVYYTDWRENK